MNPRWDGQALLAPIDSDRPCGEDLENTQLLTQFDALRLFGELSSPDAPAEAGERRQAPVWADVEARASEALGRSKDLRLLAVLAVAVLRTRGLAAFFEALTVAASWLDAYWTEVYPVVDEDLLLRRNALNCFADPMAVVDRVRRTPLVDSRHGRFSLRDVALARGDIMPVANESVPDRASLAAAFDEAPVETLKTVDRAAATAVAALTRIEDRVRTADPDMVPQFAPLLEQLSRLRDVLSSAHDLEGDREPAQSGEVTSIDTGPAPHANLITSRQEAVRTLDAVADYLRRTEPGSPVVAVIERARELLVRNFVDVLAELPPLVVDPSSNSHASGLAK
jgi:type VI secretion system protein ImpA